MVNYTPCNIIYYNYIYYNIPQGINFVFDLKKINILSGILIMKQLWLSMVGSPNHPSLVLTKRYRTLMRPGTPILQLICQTDEPSQRRADILP